jgi:hypothetical protein
MTRIAEQSFIRRILNPKIEVCELITQVTKDPEATEAVLEAMDQRIVASGVSVALISVISYLQIHTRPNLFDHMIEAGRFTDRDLAQLFKAGYGDSATEQRLCDYLYGMFREDRNRWRVEVVEGLRDRGGAESLSVLEVIRFELEPKLMTDTLVAQSIAQFQEIDGDQFLKVKTTNALKEFMALLNSAIEVLRHRVGVDVSYGKLPAERALRALGRSSSGSPVSVSSGPHHKRSAKVEEHRLNAESLLANHPDAALNKIRMAAEAICKDLLDETIAKAKNPAAKALQTLEDMRSELKQRKVAIPADADKYLTSIQSFGNLGSHDQEMDTDRIDTRMAKATMSYLEALIEWYRSFDPLLP